MAQAAAHEAAGRLPEARGTLESALPWAGYDPDLFEQYGRVLLTVGEVIEAGRWLFVSGRREPEYEHAIGAYLGKRGRRGGRRLYNSFPPQAKLGPPNKYPPPLCHELKALDVPPDVPPAPASVVLPRTFRRRLNTALGVVGCGGCVIYLAVSVVVGVVVVTGWVKDRVAALFR